MQPGDKVKVRGGRIVWTVENIAANGRVILSAPQILSRHSRTRIKSDVFLADLQAITDTDTPPE